MGFLTGPVNLTSDQTLQIESNATLRASTNFDLYRWITPLPSYGLPRVDPVLRGYHVRNVTLQGGGMLDGQGRPWAQYFNRNLKRYGYNATVSMRRPFFLSFEGCAGVKMENLTVINSPHWTVHLHDTEHVVMRRLNISVSPTTGCTTDYPAVRRTDAAVTPIPTASTLTRRAT